MLFAAHLHSLAIPRDFVLRIHSDSKSRAGFGGDMSRYLEALKAKMNTAAATVPRAVLATREAAYLARKGETANSKHILEEVRAGNSATYDSQVFAAINLAEAIAAYYSSDLGEALSRIKRCVAMCTAGRISDSTLTTALAWQAHFEQNAGDWRNAISIVRTTLSCIEPDDFEAKARIFLVLADAYEEAERIDEASAWYSRARLAIAELGDETLLEALIHNRAAIKTFNARIRGASDSEQSINVRDLELAVASEENFLQLFEITAFQWMSDLLRAQSLMLKGEYGKAESILADQSLDCVEDELHAVSAIRRADLQYCRLRRGCNEDALSVLALLARSLDGDIMPGDRALVASQISRCYQMLGMGEEMTFYRDLFEKFVGEHYRIISLMSNELDMVLHTISVESRGS